jgi:GcrA cell cycle regulator
VGDEILWVWVRENHMEWTSEAIDQLRVLWSEGHSTAEIGRRMGVSKNAIVGKAHRLNLPPRPSPIRREGAEASSTAPLRRAPPAPRPPMAFRRLGMPAPAPALAPAAAAVPDTAIPAAPRPMPVAAPVAARPVAPQAPAAPQPAAIVRPFPRINARTCCWPLGDPGNADFRFCGGEALASKPYCAEHAALAYVKVRDRREDAA